MNTTEPTIIVAGITRSGLSLTMQVLASGGVPCQGDFPAYEPFPMGSIPWNKCHGTAVKLVDAHLHLPPPGCYYVIRLQRDLTEQARSFNKWAAALFHGKAVPTSHLVASFRRDYCLIDEWSSQQARWRILHFEDIICNPTAAARGLARFLSRDLDESAMAAVVRKRSSDCYPGLLELDLIAEAKR